MSSKLILQNIIDKSIYVNGILVPLETARLAFSRYVHPLFLSYPELNPPFSFFGTAFYIKSNNKFFSIITKHQLDNSGGDPTRLGVFKGDKTEDGYDNLVTPSVINKFQESDEGRIDIEDLVIFEYELENIINKNIFLEIDEEMIDFEEKTSSASVYFICGYLTKDNEPDCDELGQWSITTRGSIVRIWEAGKFGNLISFTVVYKTLEELDNYDGMSGSPVFNIYRINNQYFRRVVGVVVRGGYGKVYAYPFKNIEDNIREILGREKR